MLIYTSNYADNISAIINLDAMYKSKHNCLPRSGSSTVAAFVAAAVAVVAAAADLVHFVVGKILDYFQNSSIHYLAQRRYFDLMNQSLH